MIAIRYPLVPRRGPRERLTLEAAAARVGLHPVLVERFVEFGLIEPAERSGLEMRFDAACLPRLAAISRLRADLGVNLHGVASSSTFSTASRVYGPSWSHCARTREALGSNERARPVQP